jgi:hypothetical protein
VHFHSAEESNARSHARRHQEISCLMTKSASLHYRDMDCATRKSTTPAETLRGSSHALRRRDNSCRHRLSSRRHQPRAINSAMCGPDSRGSRPMRTRAALLFAFSAPPNEGPVRNRRAPASRRPMDIRRGCHEYHPSESCFARSVAIESDPNLREASQHFYHRACAHPHQPPARQTNPLPTPF